MEDVLNAELTHIRSDLSEYDDAPFDYLEQEARPSRQVTNLIDRSFAGTHAIIRAQLDHIRAVHHNVHIHLRALLYASNELEEPQRVPFEKHLAQCAECKERVDVNRKLPELWKQLRRSKEPKGPCPGNVALAEYVAGFLSDLTQRDRIGKHILVCAECMANFFGLSRAYEQVVS